MQNGDSAGAPGYGGGVNALRHVLLRHRRLAAWLVAAALLMRLIVPAGYMFVGTGGGIGVTMCAGQAPVPMAMPGMGHAPHHDHRDGADKPEPPCAFSGMGHSFLSAADPILLAAAIAFVFALAFRAPAAAPARARGFTRPPVRGPPALA